MQVGVILGITMFSCMIFVLYVFILPSICEWYSNVVGMTCV